MATDAPGAPGNLSVTVSGTTVVLTWTAPATGDPATDYVLEAGAAPGSANLVAGLSTGGTALVFTANGVATGTYYVRVRARNASGLGAASNEITVRVNVNQVTLAVSARLPNGRVGQPYRFAFPAATGGSPPYHYQLDTFGGFPPIGLVLDTNGVLSGTPRAAGQATFVVCAVDLGGNDSCHPRDAAAHATAADSASSTTTLTIDAACSTPAAPSGLTASVSGSTVTLRWSAVTDATSYVLQAGSSASSSNLVAGSDVGSGTSYVASGVGNGTYYIRVRAKNACGDLGPASNEATTVVGQTTTPPAATGGITSFFGRGGCQYFDLFEFWTGCKADVTANITRAVTSGTVGVLLFWNTGGGDGLYHGDLRVTPGSVPGTVTIPVTSGSLFRRYCSNAIPVTIEIFDGPSGAGGVGVPLLYRLNSTWTGFGC